MQNTIKIGIGIAMCAGTIASASVSQINGWDDVPRLFNDRPDSQLTYMSTYDAMGSSVSFTENNYGTGGSRTVTRRGSPTGWGAGSTWITRTRSTCR